MARTEHPDDDVALRWDDVDDPSHVDVDSDSDSDSDSDVDVDVDSESERAAAAVASSATGEGVPYGSDASASPARARVITLLTGLFGAIYLAYSVGWIIGLGFVPLTGPTLLIEIMYQFSEFLAILASALWFGAVIALTRGGRAMVRLGWLAIGTLVLIPWPLILGGLL